METYRNDYTKHEDKTLWELHEIRHKLHISRKMKSIEEINKNALKKFNLWKDEATNGSYKNKT